jgi:hypothetical protein
MARYVGQRDKPSCLIKADKPGLNIHCILSIHHFPHKLGDAPVILALFLYCVRQSVNIRIEAVK